MHHLTRKIQQMTAGEEPHLWTEISIKMHIPCAGDPMCALQICLLLSLFSDAELSLKASLA